MQPSRNQKRFSPLGRPWERAHLARSVSPVICHLTRISFPFEVRIQASRSSTFRVGRSDLWLCGCFFGALPELLVVCIYERHCQSYLGARVDRLWTCNARLVPLHGTAKFMPL